MIRTLAITVVCATFAPCAQAQGVLEQVGQGLDNAGRNIRRSVETGVARGPITSKENEILARVSERIRWDKRLSKSTIRLAVSADQSIVLSGSVASEAAKTTAVEIAENTVGVTTIVDEIAVVKEVRVVKPKVAPKRVVVEEVQEEVITKP